MSNSSSTSRMPGFVSATNIAWIWLLCGLLIAPSAWGVQQEGSLPSFAGPIKITGLLWEANPESAAQTLTRTLQTAVQRGQLAELRDALPSIAPQLQSVLDSISGEQPGPGELDPRLLPSLSASLLLKTTPVEIASAVPAYLDADYPAKGRLTLFRMWIASDRQQAMAYLRQRLSVDASTGGSATETGQSHQVRSSWLASAAVVACEQDAAGTTKILVELWDGLSDEIRAAATEPMTRTADSMRALLEAIQAGRIARDVVNMNQLRKWLDSPHTDLHRKIDSLWGQIRMDDNQQRQQIVQRTLKELRSGVHGSVSRGGKVFTRVCSQCHRLHGRGFEVGPDITNNGRGNLSQLVSNVLDPSLVIGTAFQAKTVVTVDGEVLAGVVVGEDARYLRLRLQGGKTVELDKQQDIELVKSSSKSLMPEGVEQQMTSQELYDLFAYLCLLKAPQAEDNELIPGTPPDFVQP